jgi:hypothetical protein
VPEPEQVKTEQASNDELLDQAVKDYALGDDDDSPSSVPGESDAEPETTPETTPEPALPDHLVERAREYGLSTEEAREYGDAKSLERALAIADKQMAHFSRQQQQQQQRQQQDKPAEKPARKKLNKEAFHPELVEVLEQYEADFDALHKENENLKGAFHHVMGEHARRESQDFADRMDKQFETLGEGYHGVFGKGNGQAVIKSHGARSALMAARLDVMAEMAALEQGYRAYGRAMPDESELFRRAVRALHGDKVVAKATETARKEIGEKLKEQATQHTARPTHKPEREKPPSRDRAIAEVNKRLVARGLHVNGVSESDND